MCHTPWRYTPFSDTAVNTVKTELHTYVAVALLSESELRCHPSATENFNITKGTGPKLDLIPGFVKLRHYLSNDDKMS